MTGSAVIWQCAEQCYKNDAFPKGLWDQDLATDTGYATQGDRKGRPYYTTKLPHKGRPKGRPYYEAAC